MRFSQLAMTCLGFLSLALPACGGSSEAADEDPAEGALHGPQPTTPARCAVWGPGLPDAGKHFDIVKGDGYAETLKFQNIDLRYGEGKNKTTLTASQGSSTLFQVVTMTGNVDAVIALSGPDGLILKCEVPTTTPPIQRPLEDMNPDEQGQQGGHDDADSACVAMGSGIPELGEDAKSFSRRATGSHYEELKVRNLDFAFTVTQNKDVLSVSRDGKRVVELLAYPDPQDPGQLQ